MKMEVNNSSDATNDMNVSESEVDMETDSTESQPQPTVQNRENDTSRSNESPTAQDNETESLEMLNDSNTSDQGGGTQNTGIIRSESSKSLNDSSSTEDVARHELRKLSLDQNGTFMVDFDPETSQREMRKMNRRIYVKESKRNQLYDDRGLLLETSMDLCDCLDKNCQGCHFPCPKCGSGKCGVDCRCNRKNIVDFIEVEGTETTYNFPS